MSRLAKKPVPLNKTAVSVDGGVLTVKGTKGTLTRPIHPAVSLTVTPEGVTVEPNNRSKLAKALTGTYVAHVRSMVTGVETPWRRGLVLEGVGYRVEVKGNEIVFTVGFSHQVKLPIPAGITATTEKNNIFVEGIDKDVVGQFAANIRRVKPPEPYLGKGIRYAGEVIRRKQGKKAV